MIQFLPCEIIKEILDYLNDRDWYSCHLSSKIFWIYTDIEKKYRLLKIYYNLQKNEYRSLRLKYNNLRLKYIDKFTQLQLTKDKKRLPSNHHFHPYRDYSFSPLVDIN